MRRGIGYGLRDKCIQTVTSLPATGITFLAPVAGMFALASGVLIRRNRCGRL